MEWTPQTIAPAPLLPVSRALCVAQSSARGPPGLSPKLCGWTRGPQMRDHAPVRYTVEHFRAIDATTQPLGVAYVPTGRVDEVDAEDEADRGGDRARRRRRGARGRRAQLQPRPRPVWGRRRGRGRSGIVARVKTEEGMIDVPGGRVWYRSVGEGGVPLLCLHGGPGMTHDYLEPLEALATSAGRWCSTTSSAAAAPTGPTTSRCGRSSGSWPRSTPCETRSGSTGSTCSAARGAGCSRCSTCSTTRAGRSA